MAAIYTFEEGRFTPGPLAVSPWNPKHQNGIAVAGLLTHLVDRDQAIEPMMVTRLTIDIVRAVPFVPIEGEWRIVRDGRRIQIIEAVLRAGGEVAARATAVRVRLAETPATALPPLYRPQPEQSPERALVLGRQTALETRMIEGGPTRRGPGAGWARPAAEITPGVPLSILAGAAMTADIGSGAAAVLDGREWSFANVTICLHCFRPPTSDWILIEATTRTSGNGAGLVESILSDRQGPFGRCYQTLFVAPLRADREAAA